MEQNNVLLNGDFIENKTSIENEIQQGELHGNQRHGATNNTTQTT
jgi:hypothetical protein